MTAPTAPRQNFITRDHRYVYLGGSLIALLGLGMFYSAPSPYSFIPAQSVFGTALAVICWFFLSVSAMALLVKWAYWNSYEGTVMKRPLIVRISRYLSYLDAAACALLVLDRFILKLAYIVNVVIDEDKNPVAAFAGEMEQAHEAGCDFLSRYCEVRAAPADIVITSNGGAPLDQNIYQCVKGLTAAEASAKEGAVLIMCAGLADGHGGEGFYRSLCDCESPDALYQSIMATPQNETIPDQWESQILARILMKHRVIFVSPHEREALLREMKLDWAPDLDTAIAMAREEKGADALVTVIPNGVSVIVKKG